MKKRISLLLVLATLLSLAVVPVAGNAYTYGYPSVPSNVVANQTFNLTIPFTDDYTTAVNAVYITVRDSSGNMLPGISMRLHSGWNGTNVLFQIAVPQVNASYYYDLWEASASGMVQKVNNGSFYVGANVNYNYTYYVTVAQYYNQKGELKYNVTNSHMNNPLIVQDGQLNPQELAPRGSTVTKIVLGTVELPGNSKINLANYYPPTSNNALVANNVTISQVHFDDGTGGGSTTTVTDPQVKSVYAGDRFTIDGSTLGGINIADTTRYIVQSSDVSIVVVESNTSARAVKAGQAQISVFDRYSNAQIGRLVVNVAAAQTSGGTGGQEDIVEVEDSSLKIGPAKFTISKGKRYYCNPKLDGIKIDRTDLKWSSSNKKILTVDKNGRFKGVKAGTAVLTAETEDGVTAEMTITVK